MVDKWIALGLDKQKCSLVVLGFSDSLEESAPKEWRTAEETGAIINHANSFRLMPVAVSVPAMEMWLCSCGLLKEDAKRLVKALYVSLLKVLKTAS